MPTRRAVGAFPAAAAQCTGAHARRPTRSRWPPSASTHLAGCGLASSPW